MPAQRETPVTSVVVPYEAGAAVGRLWVPERWHAVDRSAYHPQIVAVWEGWTARPEDAAAAGFTALAPPLGRGLAAHAGPVLPEALDRRAELTLWRDATDFNACEPVGLGVAVRRARPSRAVTVSLDTDRPVLLGLLPERVLCHGAVPGALVIDDPWADTATGDTWLDAHLLPVPDTAPDTMSTHTPTPYGFRGAVTISGEAT